ncbi:MAG: UDP-3-O-acylglucosamine N-acyltransferase [Acidimicrobiia bacterium]|jgi:UDP-3-O-[3-hydroxymyristoyl] glucosamine N-acyltransferase
MIRTLHNLADALGADLVGDGSFVVRTVAHPLMATSPDTLALAIQPDAERALAHTKARCAMVAEGRAEALAPLAGGLVVRRPRYALARLLSFFEIPPLQAPSIHPTAVVEPGASVSDDASIGAYTTVGRGTVIGRGARILPHVTIGSGVVIGDGALVHAGVRIGDRCTLGARVILHANVVIGSDGFGFVTPEKGAVESAIETGHRVEASNLTFMRMASLGTVVVEDDVEIGAGSCVDRGTVGATRIGRGTKIDNLVQIGHNCTIGENCLIAGTCGISGSVTVGNRVSLGGGVGVSDHISIGDDAVIAARSGVATSVPAREVWGGYPAVPYKDAMRQLFNTRRVPRLLKELEDLHARVAALEQHNRRGAGHD